MTTQADYHRATNAAYTLLRKWIKFMGEVFFQTDVFCILSRLPCVTVVSYTEACDKCHLDRNFFTSVSEHGFTYEEPYKGRIRYIVYYNDWKDGETTRFTLAHEIGHIVLNHSEADDDFVEKEANCFARNLLCPVYVRTVLRLNSISDYCSIFGVSEPMAQVALDKTNLDLYHIDTEIYQELRDLSEYSLRGYTLYDLYSSAYA